MLVHVLKIDFSKTWKCESWKSLPGANSIDFPGQPFSIGTSTCGWWMVMGVGAFERKLDLGLIMTFDLGQVG